MHTTVQRLARGAATACAAALLLGACSQSARPAVRAATGGPVAPTAASTPTAPPSSRASDTRSHLKVSLTPPPVQGLRYVDVTASQNRPQTAAILSVVGLYAATRLYEVQTHGTMVATVRLIELDPRALDVALSERQLVNAYLRHASPATPDDGRIENVRVVSAKVYDDPPLFTYVWFTPGLLTDVTLPVDRELAKPFLSRYLKSQLG